MKFGRATVVWAFFAGAALETSAFVPTRVATSGWLNPTAASAGSTLLPRCAATLEPTDQRVSVDFLKSSFRDLQECTDILQDEKGYPVGALPKDVIEAALKILFQWGHLESVEGAQKVEQLIARFERESQQILNNRHYTVVVSAWAKSGHAEAGIRSEKWLMRMEEIAKTIPIVAPTRSTFGVVLNAYAEQGDAARAQFIINRMEEAPQLSPTFRDYNAVLLAFSRKGDARSAEEVLKRMVELCKESGSSQLAPDLYSYNMVLDAWARSKEPGACQRSLEILDALHVLADKDEIDLHPCGRTYTAVITAIVRSEEPNVAELAHKVFDQAVSSGITPDAYMYTSLMQAYANSGDAETVEGILKNMEDDGLANSVAYNTVIKAWKGSASPEAAERAELCLERLISLELADTISFTTVIAAYANRGELGSAEKAESILQRMNELYLQGDENVKPNVNTFNAVLNAWVQAGDPVRADILLNRMLQLCSEGESHICPSVVSFSTVINGWAKSPQRDGLEKCEGLFKRMIEMYEAGNKSARPNRISYVTLINAIIRSRDEDSAERAEGFLFQMYKQFKDGNKDVKPDAKIIMMVLDCWQKSGKADTGERAEALLDWMMDIYNTENDKIFQPNEYVFSSVISAWSKSRSFGKAVRARLVLDKMKKLHKSGAIAAAPNTHCYTSVINSCAYCINDASEKREALKIALATYKESERTPSNDGKPNHVTYATVLTALNNLLAPSTERTAAMGSIFRRCCATGQVDTMVLRRLETSLTEPELKEICPGSLVGADGSVRRENIPDEWRRNLRP